MKRRLIKVKMTDPQRVNPKRDTRNNEPLGMTKEVLTKGTKDARLMARAREARRLLQRCETILKRVPRPTPEEQRLLEDLAVLIDYVELG